MTEPKDAAPATKAANAAVRELLPFDDWQDFEDAKRGLIAPVPDGMVRSASGNPLWNLSSYSFLDKEEAPATVNPSLWRMARLNMTNGLFEVCEGVYQVRGIDLANMTIIEGERGLIIVDPLTVAETAAAALDLYHAHRPRKPVVAVIYSHSHVDHYGGVRGVASMEDVAAGRIAVIAPDGFMAAVAGENVLAGNAMTRRAQFQFGPLLRPGERGQVDAGLGKVTARGTLGLIAPTMEIVEPVETHTIDGVEMVFHLAPETEAPAEMHMFMPKVGVLNMAENACRHLHNFCPLRGSVVRDPRMWSHYLGDAIERFGADVAVLIGQHHWPTWGRERVVDHLTRQRDLYKFVHDQSARLMNKGYRPAEISEALDLPPELADEWSVRGYYGTVSHNSKAVYQRYLSWYDGNPANLHPLPPRQTGEKLVDYMGGAAKAIERAREDFSNGEFRWVAQVMSHVVFADPDNEEARELEADALEQLGYQAESATWRNAYLYGAQELRNGIRKLPPRPILAPDVLEAVGIATLFDFIAVRVDMNRVQGRSFVINWSFSDSGERLALSLRHSALTHVMGKQAADADLAVTATRDALVALILGRATVEQAIDDRSLQVTGDPAPLAALFDMLDDFDFMFEILTPGQRG
ncbi:MAG: alkyl sulfatase dimerization domain-containing protein [Alphaproteobacteria bacterium]